MNQSNQNWVVDQIRGMQAQSQASNALGGLGVLQGAANSGLSIQQQLAAQSLAGAAIGAQLRIRLPEGYNASLLDEAKQTICRLTMERDEALHTVSQLAARVTEAHREIGRLLSKYKYEVTATAEDPKPDASRIWEAIVAYSSR